MNKMEIFWICIFCLILSHFDLKQVLAARGHKSNLKGLAEICSCPGVCRPSQLSQVDAMRSGTGHRFGCVAKEGVHCDCTDCLCNTRPADFGVNYLCDADSCPMGKCGCSVERNSCANYAANPNQCPCVDEEGRNKCSRCDRTWCDDVACKCQIYGVEESRPPKVTGVCPKASSRGGKLVVGQHSFCRPNGN